MTDEQGKYEPKDELKKMRFYGLADVQKIIGVSYRTMLSYASSKRLRAVKIGGRWKVREDDLQRFLSGN